jgi:hypothetical protein
MQTLAQLKTTDAALSMAFVEATKPFTGQTGANNPALQAVIKQHGQPLINSLEATGSTRAEAVQMLRVLLAMNEIH